MYAIISKGEQFPVFQHFLLTSLKKSDTINQGIALITDPVLSDGF